MESAVRRGPRSSRWCGASWAPASRFGCRRGPRAGDAGPGAGRRAPGRARHARAVRDRHGAQPRRLDVAGAGPAPAQPAPGGRPAPADAPGRGPARARRSRPPSPQALGRLSERERETLLAHEVSGQDTRSLAAELGLTAGAVAAQLNRTRARLRVEYLLALEQAEPPTDRCRPVLLALSSGDRRRQREVDAARHLLECDLCARAEPAADGARAAARRRGPGPDPRRRGHRGRPAGRPGAGLAARLLRAPT